jgi:hypothetical protein
MYPLRGVTDIKGSETGRPVWFWFALQPAAMIGFRFASYAFLYLLSGFAVLLVPEACWFAAMALVPMVLV